MEHEPQVDLKDIWSAIYGGRLLLGVTIALSFVLGLIVSLTSPKIYQNQAIVSVPESSKLTAIASESQGTMFVMVNVGGATPYKSRPTTVTLVNVAETKAMVSQLQQRLANGDIPEPFSQNDGRNIRAIRVEPIKGSENYFRLIVFAGESQSAAGEISRKVLEYLAGNPYVNERINGEISSVQQNIKDTEEALANAVKHRDDLARSGQFRQNPNFNPADLESSIGSLKMRLANLKNHQTGISSYRYIETPSGSLRAVKPNLLTNLLMSLALCLFLGLLAVFLKQGLAENINKIRGGGR